MKLSVRNTNILILILINSGLSLPLTSKNYTELPSKPELFFMDKDRRNPDEKISEKSNVSVDTTTESAGGRLSMPIIQRRRIPRARQILEQFSQKNLQNNIHDASNMQRILWQQYNRKNFGSKLSPFGSTGVLESQANTLQSQETAQIDPVYAVKKITPSAPAVHPDEERLNPNNYDDSTEIIPTSGNLFVDLLHDRRPNFNTDSFGSSKISRPLFSTSLTALSSSFNEITYSEEDCALIARTMPVLLINSFVNSLIAIGKLPKSNILMIPFVVLSLINFIISSSIVDEHCPAGRV